MSNDLVQYLYDNNFKKQLKLLEKKLQGKRVIIYGAGQFFQLINEYYDLSKFDIIGVTDKKFTDNDKEFLGYPVVQLSNVKKVNPDFILVAIYKYLQVIDILETETFKNCCFKILPLIKKQYEQGIFLPEYLRGLIYLKEFFKNLFLYKNKKLHVEKLQIWTGQTCTLKCKNCSQLFPYITPKIYDIENVINNAKKVLKHCDVESLHIIGGEPFTNKDIYKLIEFVATKNPNQPNKIITNGTILPNEQTLNILEKYKKDIYITISSYNCAKDRQQRFKDLCNAKGIKCVMIDEETPWFYLGNSSMTEIKNKENIIQNFNACWDKTCFTIADKELSICPRMHNSPEIFKHKKWFIENLALKYIKPNLFSRALIATCFSNRTYREACKYCYGVSNINKLYCVRGEQIEQ